MRKHIEYRLRYTIGGVDQDGGQVFSPVRSAMLCYTHFIRKRPVNIVKSLVSNFYEAKDVTAAKDILVENVAALEVEGWPRPVNRRDTPDKTKNEMNDIFGLLEWIDLKGLHERLPTYVSSNPEHLPPILL